MTLVDLSSESGEPHVEPFLPLEAFTAVAVQFRYEAETEPMELGRQFWQQQAEVLVSHVAAICAAVPLP